MRLSLYSLGPDLPAARTGFQTKNTRFVSSDVKVRVRPHARRTLETIRGSLGERIETLVAEDNVSVDSIYFRPLASYEGRNNGEHREARRQT